MISIPCAATSPPCCGNVSLVPFRSYRVVAADVALTAQNTSLASGAASQAACSSNLNLVLQSV